LSAPTPIPEPDPSARHQDHGPITVCFLADAGIVMPLAVALHSLFARHRPDELVAYLFHDAIPAADLARLKQSVPAGAELRVLPMNTDAVAGVKSRDGLPRASAQRLLLGAMLPAEQARVIYLDSDVMIMDSLRPLWESDLGGHALGAVRDAAMPWIGSPAGTLRPLRWRKLAVPPDAPYFNAGMLLIDLVAWRRLDLGGKALRAGCEHELPCTDQDALFAACGGRFQQLHPRWNMIPTHFDDSQSMAWICEGPERMDEALACPAMIHFTRTFRPWVKSLRASHPHAQGWFEHLDQTPWHGWRPRLRPMKLLGRILDRALGR